MLLLFCIFASKITISRRTIFETVCWVLGRLFTLIIITLDVFQYFLFVLYCVFLYIGTCILQDLGDRVKRRHCTGQAANCQAPRVGIDSEVWGGQARA